MPRVAAAARVVLPARVAAVANVEQREAAAVGEALAWVGARLMVDRHTLAQDTVTMAINGNHAWNMDMNPGVDGGSWRGRRQRSTENRSEFTTLGDVYTIYTLLFVYTINHYRPRPAAGDGASEPRDDAPRTTVITLSTRGGAGPDQLHRPWF